MPQWHPPKPGVSKPSFVTGGCKCFPHNALRHRVRASAPHPEMLCLSLGCGGFGYAPVVVRLRGRGAAKQRRNGAETENRPDSLSEVQSLPRKGLGAVNRPSCYIHATDNRKTITGRHQNKAEWESQPPVYQEGGDRSRKQGTVKSDLFLAAPPGFLLKRQTILRPSTSRRDVSPAQG